MKKLTTFEINEMRYAMKLNDIQKFADYLEISSYDAFLYINNNLNNCKDIDEKLRKLLTKYIVGKFK